MIGYRTIKSLFVSAPAPVLISPPKPLAPIDNTMRVLARAYDAMMKERDDLDHQIRVMSERSRQLYVSSAAIKGAIGELEIAATLSDSAKEVAHAEGR